MMTDCQQPRHMTRLDILDVAHLGYQTELTNMIFKVIDNIHDLKQQVYNYINLDTQDDRPCIVVYDVSQGRLCWTTLVIYKSKTMYYMSPQGRMPHGLRQLFREFLFVEKALSPPCEPHDCGVVALHHAMKLNEILNNKSLVVEQRKLYEEQIEIMNTQRAKLDMLLKRITKYQNNSDEFSYQSANMFLYFLETVALQNEGIRKYKTELTNVMGKEDVARVSHVRTKVLVHRAASTPVIIEPQHLKVLINDEQLNGVSAVQGFFDNMENYVQSALDKFNYSNFDDGAVVPPRSFLKDTISNIGNLVSEQELTDEVEMFLRKMLKEAFKDCRRNFADEQKFIFYLIVNFAPYSIPNKKCPKTLEKIQYLRNLQIHDFYKFNDDEYALRYSFINYLRENRNCLFKCFYARDVYKISKDLNTNINNDANRDRIVQELDASLGKFKEELDDANTALAQPSIEHDCKLLLVIANETTIKLRKDKLYNNQITTTRYDQLSVVDLMHIRSELMKLKQIKSEDVNQFNIHIATLETEWETHYDILKKHFKLLVDLLIDDVGIMDNNLDAFIARVKTDLTALTAELECSINTSFTVDYVLEAYKQRGNRTYSFTRGAFQEKISCIPARYKAQVRLTNNYFVELDTDNFVSTIFEMRSNEDRRRKDYGQVQEAFDDPEFLDYVEAQNIQFPKLIDNVNIGNVPDYMAPLLARVIITKGIKPLTPLKYVLPLLQHKDISHFVNLLDYAKDSKNKFSLVWKTLWDRMKTPNFAFETIDIVFDDSDRKVIINVVIECINCIGITADDNTKKETRSIVWKLLQRFETVVVKTLFMDDHPGALQKLLDDSEIKDITDKTKNRVPEVLWRLRLTEAKIKWKVWELNKRRCQPQVYQACLDSSVDILEKLMLDSDPDHFDEHYFVTSNYLGLALHSKGRPDKAYSNNIKLQERIVKYILGIDIAAIGPWANDIYENILNSDKHKNMSEDLDSCATKYFDINDYPNIFRIRKSTAYYLHCRGTRYNNSNSIADFMEALQLFNEVLRVLNTHCGEDMIREVIRTKKSLCKVYSDLGRALLTSGDHREALKYGKEHLKLTTDLVESQKQLFWATHPAVIEYFYYTIYAYHDIAQLPSRLLGRERRVIYNQFKEFVDAHIHTVEMVSKSSKMESIKNYIRDIRLRLG